MSIFINADPLIYDVVTQNKLHLEQITVDLSAVDKDINNLNMNSHLSSYTFHSISREKAISDSPVWFTHVRNASNIVTAPIHRSQSYPPH